ncbi:MAG: hypothetical protein PHO53_02170 [Actinomycetota bacterium]|nr:hypothetical protein [Actinomycetota bacterium]
MGRKERGNLTSGKKLEIFLEAQQSEITRAEAMKWCSFRAAQLACAKTGIGKASLDGVKTYLDNGVMAKGAERSEEGFG